MLLFGFPGPASQPAKQQRARQQIGQQTVSSAAIAGLGGVSIARSQPAGWLDFLWADAHLWTLLRASKLRTRTGPWASIVRAGGSSWPAAPEPEASHQAIRRPLCINIQIYIEASVEGWPSPAHSPASTHDAHLWPARPIGRPLVLAASAEWRFDASGLVWPRLVSSPRLASLGQQAAGRAASQL